MADNNKIWRYLGGTLGPHSDGMVPVLDGDHYVLKAGDTMTGPLTATRFISTQATGSAPFTVSSTTLVSNLNAQLFDSQNSSYYRNASNLNSGTVPSDRVAGQYNGITSVGTQVTSFLTNSTSDITSGRDLIALRYLDVEWDGIIGGGITVAGRHLSNSTFYGPVIISSGYGLTAQGPVQGSRFISTQATGTAPLQVASTTMVNNLNAHYLNGQLGSFYASASAVSQLETAVLPGAWTNITTFVSGWGSASGSHQVAQYRKNGEGRVQLRGMAVRTGSNLATGAHNIITMPVGYRPAATTQLGVVATAQGPAALEIGTDGIIKTRSSGFPITYPTNTTIPIEGIEFSV